MMANATLPHIASSSDAAAAAISQYNGMPSIRFIGTPSYIRHIMTAFVRLHLNEACYYTEPNILLMKSLRLGMLISVDGFARTVKRAVITMTIAGGAKPDARVPTKGSRRLVVI